MNAVLSRNSPRIGNREAFTRRHSAWASGDYAAVGNALQMVSEALCESVNLSQDERVLDVAAGNCHASGAKPRPPASRSVRSRSAVRGRRRGSVPFPDQSFSAVISAFGVMFAGDQERAASEMIRLCRRGRRVRLVNWTPDGFMGRIFRTVAPHPPATATGTSPFNWGTEHRLDELFSVYGAVETTKKRVALCARTPMDWVDKLRASYSPVLETLALLDCAAQKTLRSELLELVQHFNRANDSTMLVDAEYLEVVVQRR